MSANQEAATAPDGRALINPQVITNPLSGEQHATARRLPNPLDLALFMRDFEREVRAPYLPATLVRAVTRPAAWLARRCGLDARYRRLRGAPGGRPPGSTPRAPS